MLITVQRSQNWYSEPWQAFHSELPVAVRPAVYWMFSYICCVYSASISSLLRGIQSLSGWLTERGSDSCQRSMIDALEMEQSQWGFCCHSWMCRGLQDGRGLIHLRMSAETCGDCMSRLGLHIKVSNTKCAYMWFRVRSDWFLWQRNNALPTSFKTAEAKDSFTLSCNSGSVQTGSSNTG